MAQERWGTFSVIDHKNVAALVPEVLLYDRLVIPVPPDDDERQRWKKNGWEPDLLDQRLETLSMLGGDTSGEDFVIKVPWNNERMKKFHDRMEQINHIRMDANSSIPYQMTRRVIAMEQKVNLTEGSHVVVVAAYQSESDFRADFDFSPISRSFLLQNNDEKKYSNLGLMLGHKIAIPADVEPSRALEKAVRLARTTEFKEQRRKLYEWQEKVIKNGISEEKALREMDQKIRDYNEYIEKANKNVLYKFTFAAAPLAIGLLKTGFTGEFDQFSTASGVVSIIGFTRFGLKSIIEPGKAEPAAMFHKSNKALNGPWWERLKRRLKRSPHVTTDCILPIIFPVMLSIISSVYCFPLFSVPYRL
jgi:hypothetical protein